MAAVLETVAPVFGLILLGLLAARLRLVGEAAGKGLADFVFTFALPALLFRTMVVAAADAPSAWGIIGSYYIANGAVWIATSLLMRRGFGRPADETAALAMGAAFGNTVMLGLPLGLQHFGPAAAAPIAIVIALHAPLLWVVATLQAEWSGTAGLKWSRLGPMLTDLALNPVILGVVAGGLWHMTGFGLAPVADGFLTLLGAAGVPGALFALGIGLARFEVRGQVGIVTVLLAAKLLLLPVFAYALATWAFALPPIATGVVTLLAACPTGANAYLFANRHERGLAPVAAAIAIGTALSVVTISIVLVALGARAS